MNSKRLMQRLTPNPHAWTRMQVLVWSRAGFRCEYCHRDLLHSSIYYDMGELDHIDPHGPQKAAWNLALCCRICNRIKRRFRPERMPNPRTDRLAAIRSFDERIRQGWKKKRATFAAIRSIVAERQ